MARKAVWPPTVPGIADGGMRRDDRGFTLIEILTTVVIIAVLAAILIATFLRARAQSAVAASKTNMKSIAVALETYFVDNDTYPGALPALAPKYVRAIPQDPCTNLDYAYATGGSSPLTDYELSVIFPLTNPCRLIAAGLRYTPGGGLEEVP